jgi:acyl-coenzyme A thioesterase PaaI-like protein
MEVVGETLAKETLKPEGLDLLVLESLHIDYHSAGKGKVKIVAEPLALDVETLQMRVGIYRLNGRMVSEGKLRWSVKQQQSKL